LEERFTGRRYEFDVAEPDSGNNPDLQRPSADAGFYRDSPIHLYLAMKG
jgi:hypothetical protein